MKILTLDIETMANKGYFWQLWKQDIPLNMVETPAYILCWAAKWLDQDEVLWESKDRVSYRKMLLGAHALLDEADVVVHYFGTAFDIPWLNGQFAANDIAPPSPYQQIDLQNAVKKNFYLPSSKLEFVAQYFGLGGKVKHEGFELWLKCAAGDAAAWDRMAAYNKRDVVLTEKLYHKLLPWIPYHPHVGEPGSITCPACGSSDVMEMAKLYRARVFSYRQYQCNACGAWSRSSKAIKSERRLTQGVKV